MKKIAFAGTFDPITNGHIWVIEEALKIADEVEIMVAKNSNKNPLFSETERLCVIEQTLVDKGWSHKVRARILKNDYTALAARRLGCEYQIRGLRSAMDFDYEALIQKTNADVLHGVRTIFVMPPPVLDSVSSSYIKSLIGPPGWHWYIKQFIPRAVYDLWIRKFLYQFFMDNTKSSDGQYNEDAKEEFLKTVFENYTDSRRSYHTLDHITHCVQELQWVTSNYGLNAEQIKDLTFSIYAHDIIQFTDDKSVSDEEKSALWFKSWANKNNYDNPRVENMIRATGYLSGNVQAQSWEERLMCSIDLSILAQEPEIYKIYMQEVAHEYKEYTDEQYRKGRINALQKLLARDKLYLHEYYESSEELAKKNLKNELENWEG